MAISIFKPVSDFEKDHLYVKKHEAFRAFNIVLDSEGQSYEATISKQIKIWLQIKREEKTGKFSFTVEKKNIADKDGKSEKILLSNLDLQRIKLFLDLIVSFESLSELKTGKYALADEEIKKLFDKFLGQYKEQILDAIKTGMLKSEDIVIIQNRRAQLKLFEKLLYKNGLDDYKNTVMHNPNTKDETAWQHFFQNNDWIFGYGLDYKFQSILQKEFCASPPDAAGKGVVKADYLLGDRRFTTFVELKLPSTPLFGKSQNRSNAWRLSDELLEAYSQILEQKASGQLRIENEKCLHDGNGEEINQRAYDPRAILIIGSWDKIQSEEDSKTKKIKEKTFELFRRDSRNVEIITYDELYERATFIVESGRKNNSQAS